MLNYWFHPSRAPEIQQDSIDIVHYLLTCIQLRFILKFGMLLANVVCYTSLDSYLEPHK